VYDGVKPLPVAMKGSRSKRLVLHSYLSPNYINSKNAKRERERENV